MNIGRSLNDVAAELQRQAHSRRDYIAPQGQLKVEVVDGEVMLDGINGKPLGIRPHAHGQFADHLAIPVKYYNRMRAEQPELLARNMNTWLQAEAAEKRMVRALDGNVRAYLSSKYRPLDNFDLAQIILPKLLEMKAQITSCELTETRFYIKAILPHLSDAPPPNAVWGQGHVILKDRKLVSSIVISNSDVGAGTLKIEPGVFDTYCTNLAILAQAAMKKYHVGRSFEADANLEIFRDETRVQDDKAFWMKVQDVANAAFAEETFATAIEQIRNAANVPIVSTDLPKVVEVATRRLALPESLGGDILTHLARGGDLTQWGLCSAITATANDRDDYELSTELERTGGKVLALAGRDWDYISMAKAAA